MKATSRLKFIITLLSLMTLSNGQTNGQQRQPRKLFPIDHNTAFISTDGQVVIDGTRPELLAEIKKASPKLDGFRSEQGIGVRFDEFSEGLAVAGWALCPMCRNPFWVNGIIDETGRLVIPPRTAFTRFGDFREGMAKYHERGWGFIDRQGQVVIPARFYEAADFSEGMAAVRASDQGQFGFINQKGDLVVRYRFAWASDFHDGLAAVELSKNKYAFIDRTGRVTLQDSKWLNIADFSEGLARVQVEVVNNSVYRGYQDRKFGFIDRKGGFVIQPRFDHVQKFSEGRALFMQTGKSHSYGFIDTSGQVVIKPDYADGKSFSEGLAAVAVISADEKKVWGFINPEGEWVIRPQFQNADSFDGGLAAVNCDQYGTHCEIYVDTTGRTVWRKR